MRDEQNPNGRWRLVGLWLAAVVCAGLLLTLLILNILRLAG